MKDEDYHKAMLESVQSISTNFQLLVEHFVPTNQRIYTTKDMREAVAFTSHDFLFFAFVCSQCKERISYLIDTDKKEVYVTAKQADVMDVWLHQQGWENVFAIA